MKTLKLILIMLGVFIGIFFLFSLLEGIGIIMNLVDYHN